jgi:hypothetical protein
MTVLAIINLVVCLLCILGSIISWGEAMFGQSNKLEFVFLMVLFAIYPYWYVRWVLQGRKP